ncbi:MAG: hypothetical protein ACUZ8E_17960 [Candidatus Anammoxibacter sp.]
MTAISQPRFISGLKAGADLSALLFRAVKISAANVVIQAGAGDQAIGILQNAPLEDEAAVVASIGGGAFAVAGGTITAGASLKSDGAGKLIATTTDGDFVVAVAITAAVLDDVIHVDIVNQWFGDSDAKGLIVLSGTIADISTADSTAFFVAPVAGVVTEIKSVLRTAITVADADITAEIGGTEMTDSLFTIATSGSAPGDIDGSTPSALNAVSEDDLITVLSDGGSTTAAAADIFITIQPS